ncbi:MAG: hypothetical protein ACK51E_03200 [Gemmatimonadota bacterium]|jgi:hypothetical protein
MPLRRLTAGLVVPTPVRPQHEPVFDAGTCATASHDWPSLLATLATLAPLRDELDAVQTQGTEIHVIILERGSTHGVSSWAASLTHVETRRAG